MSKPVARESKEQNSPRHNITQELFQQGIISPPPPFFTRITALVFCHGVGFSFGDRTSPLEDTVAPAGGVFSFSSEFLRS